MTYYVCTPHYGDAKPAPDGAEHYYEGEHFSPNNSEGYVRRYGDDCDPVVAFAAFFQALCEDEWASIYYCM